MGKIMDSKIIFWRGAWAVSVVKCLRSANVPVGKFERLLPTRTSAFPGRSASRSVSGYFLFLTKNFHSILGEVAVGGDDWHAVEHGGGQDEAIGRIAVMPWEAVGLKCNSSGNFIDPDVMVCDDLLKPCLGFFWKFQLGFGGLKTDFPSAYRRNANQTGLVDSFFGLFAQVVMTGCEPEKTACVKENGFRHSPIPRWLACSGHHEFELGKGDCVECSVRANSKA